MSSMSSPTSAAVTATAHMTERVGIVAITRNGAAQAVKLAQLLPASAAPLAPAARALARSPSGSSDRDGWGRTGFVTATVAGSEFDAGTRVGAAGSAAVVSGLGVFTLRSCFLGTSGAALLVGSGTGSDALTIEAGTTLDATNVFSAVAGDGTALFGAADNTDVTSSSNSAVRSNLVKQFNDLRDQIDGCIGCGCLSLKVCPLRNEQDCLAGQGAGPHFR